MNTEKLNDFMLCRSPPKASECFVGTYSSLTLPVVNKKTFVFDC